MIGLGEYFLQRRAQALAERIPELDRQELEALVGRAMEYGSTSEVLWAHEHPAHALRQEHHALVTLLAALAKVNPEWLRGDGGKTPEPAGAPPGTEAPPAPEPKSTALAPPAPTQSPEGLESSAPSEAAPSAANDIDDEWGEPVNTAPVAGSEPPGIAKPTGAQNEHPATSTEPTPPAGRNEPAVLAMADYPALPFFPLSKRARSAALRAIAARRAPDFPESNDGMTREHQALYETWVRGREALTPKLLTLLPSVRNIRALRRRRMTVALGWVVFAVACALYAFRGWSKGYTVLASGTFGPSYARQAATDGDENTEWLLPEAQDGFIEVVFNRSRALSRVKILNAHNPPYNDRATRDFQLLVYSTDGAPLTFKRSFPTLAASPTWMTVDIPPQRVKRLRVEVKNYHKRGGGLAELAWE